jgi:hypothetical protein
MSVALSLIYPIFFPVRRRLSPGMAGGAPNYKNCGCPVCVGWLRDWLHSRVNAKYLSHLTSCFRVFSEKRARITTRKERGISFAHAIWAQTPSCFASL